MPQTDTVLVLENHPTLLLYSVAVVEDAGFTALAADSVSAASGVTQLGIESAIRS